MFGPLLIMWQVIIGQYVLQQEIIYVKKNSYTNAFVISLHYSNSSHTTTCHEAVKYDISD